MNFANIDPDSKNSMTSSKCPRDFELAFLKTTVHCTVWQTDFETEGSFENY